MKNNLSVYYMPYLNMGETGEIDFGFAKIWNFDLLKDKYVKNKVLKEKLEKVFSMYVSNNSKVKGIGIFSIGKDNFRKFTEEEITNTKICRFLLFLSFLSKNNTQSPGPNVGHYMATSENFDLIMQKFSLDNDYTAEQTGSIITFNRGGYTLDQVKIQTPSYVPSPKFSVDTELFQNLIKLKRDNPRVFKRIINATDILLESYYNTPSVSYNARILLQMSSFEILLNIPNNNMQRKYFKEKIGKLTNLPNERRYVNYYSSPKSIKNREKLSIKQLWAENFYKLRNKIIHGESPAIKDFNFKNKQRHFDLAIIFFIFCVKKQLEKNIKGYNCFYEIRWKNGFIFEPSYRSIYKLLFKKPA